MNALLEAGAHKNIKNNKGYTPLDRAGGECRQILFLAGARRAITRGDFTLDELGQI